MNTTEIDTVNDQTTYICLFHSTNQAEAAVKDLTEAGIPRASIGLMGKSNGGGTTAANPAAMEKWRIPERDAKHLMDRINKGGVVVAVSGKNGMGDKVEEVFKRNQAMQIDETNSPSRQASAAQSTAKDAMCSTDGGTIDVVEENLVVGKRQVQTGGVRVFSRIVETPVNESVSLQEEHAHVDRHAVDRPVKAEDGNLFKEQCFEMTESGQDAVVSKTARVVEEVSIGKETTQRNERVQDTVRHTEVDVDQMKPERARGAGQRN